MEVSVLFSTSRHVQTTDPERRFFRFAADESDSIQSSSCVGELKALPGLLVKLDATAQMVRALAMGIGVLGRPLMQGTHGSYDVNIVGPDMIDWDLPLEANVYNWSHLITPSPLPFRTGSAAYEDGWGFPGKDFEGPREGTAGYYSHNPIFQSGLFTNPGTATDDEIRNHFAKDSFFTAPPRWYGSREEAMDALVAHVNNVSPFGALKTGVTYPHQVVLPSRSFGSFRPYTASNFDNDDLVMQSGGVVNFGGLSLTWDETTKRWGFTQFVTIAKVFGVVAGAQWMHADLTLEFSGPATSPAKDSGRVCAMVGSLMPVGMMKTVLADYKSQYLAECDEPKAVPYLSKAFDIIYSQTADRMLRIPVATEWIAGAREGGTLVCEPRFGIPVHAHTPRSVANSGNPQLITHFSELASLTMMVGECSSPSVVSVDASEVDGLRDGLETEAIRHQLARYHHLPHDGGHFKSGPERDVHAQPILDVLRKKMRHSYALAPADCVDDGDTLFRGEGRVVRNPTLDPEYNEETFQWDQVALGTPPTGVGSVGVVGAQSAFAEEHNRMVQEMHNGPLGTADYTVLRDFFNRVNTLARKLAKDDK